MRPGFFQICAFFSVDRSNLLSFRTEDHGARDGSPLLPWIQGQLRQRGLPDDGEITLQCFPRVLGYVFNPVSFWFCHDREGQLRAVLAEVARLRKLGLPEEQVTEWAAWANREGLAACETLIADEAGPFCFGDTPTLADLCLVPQLANARRFGVDVSAYPRLLKAEAATKQVEAFADAAPDRQPDAE